MRRNTGMIVAALALALVSRAEAGIEKAGTTAANFLSLGAGAGVLGMGGASLGATGDLNLLNWNVASLGQLNETQFVISHASLSNQTSQEWAAVGGRLGHTATRWAISGLYQGDGSFEGRDALGGSTGSFNVSSMAFGGHLAQNVGDHVAIGLGAKFVSENLGSVSGWGGTFDAGLQFRSNGLGLGLAAQNFGGRMMYGGTPYPMPTNVGLGAAYEIPGSGLRLALDANFPSAYYSDVRGGVEWRWKDRLALRTGYRSEMGSSSDALTGPTFGMGAGMRGMWFDYGYLVGGGAGEGEHRIGLSFHPGAFNWSGEQMDAAPRTQTEAPVAKPSVRATPVKSESKTKAVSTTPSESNSIAPAVKPASVTPSPVPPAAKPTSMAPSSSSKPTSDATPKTVTPTATPAPTPKATTPVEAPKSAVATPSKLGPPLPSTTPAPTPKVVTPVALPAAKVDAPKTGAAKATALKTETPKTDALKAADAPKTEAANSAATTPEATKSTDAATPASAAKTDDASAKTDAPAASDGAKNGEPAKEAPAKAVAPSATPIPTYRPSAKPSPAAEASAPVARPAKVQVKKGETLYSIAKAYGTSPAAIMMENNMVSENVKTGQTLKLPKN